MTILQEERRGDERDKGDGADEVPVDQRARPPEVQRAEGGQLDLAEADQDMLP